MTVLAAYAHMRPFSPQNGRPLRPQADKKLPEREAAAFVPVAEGRDEVQAAMHAIVLDVLAVQATLVSEVLLELLVDVVRHRLPAVWGTTERQRGEVPGPGAPPASGRSQATPTQFFFFF